MEVPPITHCVLFLLMVFTWSGDAARKSFQDSASVQRPSILAPIAQQLRTLLSSEAAQTVCGSGEITELLQSKTSQDIRTTQWGKIKAIALDYLKNKDSRIAEFNTKIEQLDIALQERLREEQKTWTDEDKIRELIITGLEAENSFGDLQTTIDSQCGEKLDLSRQLGVSFDSYDAAVEGFKAAVEAHFTGDIRAMGSLVQGVCSKLLKPANDDLGMDCGELCNAFSETAQEMSDESASALAGQSSNELRRIKEEMLDSLSRARSQREQCDEVRETIEEFEDQIKALQDDIKDSHKLYRKARSELAQASKNLEDLGAQVEKQADFTTMAAELAEKAGMEAASALEKVNDLKDQEEKLRAALKNIKEKMASSSKVLDNVQKADETVKELKQKASQVMLKMVLLSQQAVREPLERIGFPVDGDVEVFPVAPTETKSANAVRTSLKSLTNFCTETATPAFELITKVDLHPLCTFGASEEEIVEGLDEAVVKRMEIVQEFTGDVQDSLGPSRAERQLAAMTPRSKGKVLSWEPQGIRQITSSYGATEFFKEYLTNWRAAGLFQQLYEVLETLISQVKAHLTELSGAGQGLTKDLAALEEKLRLANEEWQALVENKKLSEQQQMLAEKVLGKLKQRMESAGDRRAALEEAFRLAKERYNHAVQLLEETHQKGVAMLEFKPMIEAKGLIEP